MDHPAASPAWTTELGFRIRRYFFIKTFGITAATWLFFIGYFYLLRHPAYPVTVMPLTALDRLIPLQPAALVAYLSLWLYVGFAPALQRTFLELIVYGLWIGAMCLTGLALFYFWPTAVPPRPVDVSDFPGFALMQGIDLAGNACPSMHVAAAIFTAIWVDHVLRLTRSPIVLRAINAAWFVAIAYSTMAVRQHVALDVAAGALLGVIFVLPSLHWRPGKGGSVGSVPGQQRISSDGTQKGRSDGPLCQRHLPTVDTERDVSR
jgi:membrane-associated phospholipid phosphatase